MKTLYLQFAWNAKDQYPKIESIIKLSQSENFMLCHEVARLLPSFKGNAFGVRIKTMGDGLDRKFMLNDIIMNIIKVQSINEYNADVENCLAGTGIWAEF